MRRSWSLTAGLSRPRYLACAGNRDEGAGVTARVLVVEDEEPVRRIIVRNLGQRGYRVDEACSVAEGLQSCLATPPDVLILDINLPDGSGWDVLRALTGRGVPWPRVIAMSAVPPTRRRRAEFSPVVFLPKPFLIDGLLRAVEWAAMEGRDGVSVDTHTV